MSCAVLELEVGGVGEEGVGAFVRCGDSLVGVLAEGIRDGAYTPVMQRHLIWHQEEAELQSPASSPQRCFCRFLTTCFYGSRWIRRLSQS